MYELMCFVCLSAFSRSSGQRKHEDVNRYLIMFSSHARNTNTPMYIKSQDCGATPVFLAAKTLLCVTHDGSALDRIDRSLTGSRVAYTDT